MKQLLIILFACILMHAVTSCEKFVDVPLPADRLGDEKMFSNDQMALGAVSGIYSNMFYPVQGITAGSLSSFGGMSSDEGRAFFPQESDVQFEGNDISIDNNYVLALWKETYWQIFHVNKCLEGIQGSSGLTPALKDQLTGELLTIRSFYYFYLINLWGDAPFATSSDHSVNGRLARSSKELIYDSITAHLLKAKSLLKNEYPSAGQNRPNKLTAAALLSRIYLYRKKWTDAEREATEVIDANLYDLPAPANSFLADSKEAIWQITNPVGQGIVPEVGLFKPRFGSILFVLKDDLVNAFHAADLRKQSWIGNTESEGVTYHYPAKYKFNGDEPLPKEAYILLRFAEQWLIRAEARAEQENLSDALDDLNRIRSRADLDDITTVADKSELVNLIMEERRREFFCELGHRWLDIKRRDLGSQVLGPIKPGWNKNKELYPIPLADILVNKNLKQNEGYTK